MQTYDFSVGVGETKEINSFGSYFHYLSGDSGGLNNAIQLRHDSSGTNIILYPGMSYRVLRRNDVVGKWIISNLYNEATINGRVFIGDGDIRDHRVSGRVSVVDSDRSATKAGLAYFGGAAYPSVASRYSVIGLFNIGNINAKYLCIVNRIYARSILGGACDVIVGALSNADNASAPGYGAMFQAGPANKNIGMPSSRFGIKTFDIDAATATNGLWIKNMTTIRCASEGGVLSFDKPIIIGNGKALLLMANNVGIAGEFDFTEEIV